MNPFRKASPPEPKAPIAMIDEEAYEGWIKSLRADLAESNKKIVELQSSLSLTERQRTAFAKMLCFISSWTSARYDQHLRYDVGDEDADAIINWLHAEGINPEEIGNKRVK